MKSKLAFLLLALAATLVFASGLDAQCCGEKKAAGDAAPAVAQQSVPGGSITTGALVALIRAGAPITIVDARVEATDPIPGAKTLSEDCLGCSKTLAKTVGGKDRLVVTYSDGPKCSAGTAMAAKLRAAGYTNVIEYREGIEGWKSVKAMGSCGSSCGSSCGGEGKSEVCPSSGATKSCGSCPSAKAGMAKAPAAIIDTVGLKALMDAKVPVVVLDARSGKYDDGTRIPGAVAFNCEGCTSKPEALAKIVKSKDQLVVTYCGATQCPLSSMLASKLRALGYTNVIEYKDGIASWKKAGLKTVDQKASCCGTCGGDSSECTEKKSECGSGCGGSAKKSGCGSSCGGK